MIGGPAQPPRADGRARRCRRTTGRGDGGGPLHRDLRPIAHAPAVPDRPNILLVMADQLSTRALPPYAALAKAPATAALAAEGVVFDAAYAASPLCAPSRAAVMTGLLPSRTGAYDNAADFPTTLPTIAHRLRVEGYRTCLAGKMHFVGPDQLHGYEERVTTDIYPAGFGWTPDWRHDGARLPWYHDMSAVFGAGVQAATLQLDYDDEVAFRARRWLTDAARGRDGRPFFLTVSFSHPHDPYQVPREYFERYRDDEIPPPPLAEPDPSTLDPHSLRLRAMIEADVRRPSDDDVRRARRAYCAAVSYVDDRLAELTALLTTLALRDDTVVVLTSDHGDFLGERGLWYKMSFLEPAARVPLVVSAPGRLAPRRVGRPVSLVDLVPTLLELAGAPDAASETDGTSLVSLLEEGRGGPERVLGEYLAEGVHAPAVMLRSGRHKLVACDGDPDQLYDLAEDPLELVNLAASPSHAGLHGELRRELEALWDLDALHARVLDSQRARHLVVRALGQGAYTSWDFEPFVDAGSRYVRSRSDLYELQRRARLDLAEPPRA